MALERKDAGFTIIEALAAFTILAISIASLMGGLSTAFRRDLSSQTRQEFLEIARAKLEGVGVQERLREGASFGTVRDRYRWTSTVTRYSRAPAPLGAGFIEAFWIDIVVEQIAGDGPSPVRLQTVKLQGVH